jgi:hypothetical protein
MTVAIAVSKGTEIVVLNAIARAKAMSGIVAIVRHEPISIFSKKERAGNSALIITYPGMTKK